MSMCTKSREEAKQIPKRSSVDGRNSKGTHQCRSGGFCCVGGLALVIGGRNGWFRLINNINSLNRPPFRPPNLDRSYFNAELLFFFGRFGGRTWPAPALEVRQRSGPGPYSIRTSSWLLSPLFFPPPFFICSSLPLLSFSLLFPLHLYL